MTRPAPDIAKDLLSEAAQFHRAYPMLSAKLREAAAEIDRLREALKAEMEDSDCYWRVIRTIACTPVWTEDPEAQAKAITFQTLARNAHSGRARARSVLGGGDGQ